MNEEINIDRFTKLTILKNEYDILGYVEIDEDFIINVKVNPISKEDLIILCTKIIEICTNGRLKHDF